MFSLAFGVSSSKAPMGSRYPRPIPWHCSDGSIRKSVLFGFRPHCARRIPSSMGLLVCPFQDNVWTKIRLGQSGRVDFHGINYRSGKLFWRLDLSRTKILYRSLKLIWWMIAVGQSPRLPKMSILPCMNHGPGRAGVASTRLAQVSFGPLYP